MSCIQILILKSMPTLTTVLLRLGTPVYRLTNSLMKLQLALFVIIHECATEVNRHGLGERNQQSQRNSRYQPSVHSKSISSAVNEWKINFVKSRYHTFLLFFPEEQEFWRRFGYALGWPPGCRKGILDNKLEGKLIVKLCTITFILSTEPN
jgi:hypothetical protein